MTCSTRDNLLLYLCLNGCNLKVSSSGDGWVGGGQCSCLAQGRSGLGGGGVIKGKVSQLVNTKSVFIKEEGRAGSVLFRTGTFFLHQSHHQSAASSSLWMDAIRTPEDFFVLLFSRQRNCLFCMIKCRIFLG